MDPEKFQVWIGVATGLVAVASSIGILPVLIWYARFAWQRFRWLQFEQLMTVWVKDEWRDPSDLSDMEWKSLCAIKLSDAGFNPDEIQPLLEMAVLIARGRASLERYGRVQQP